MTPLKAYSNIEQQAQECSGQCGESRKMYGEYCAVTYCNYAAGYNNGYFHRSSNGECVPCSSDEKVAITGSAEKAECTACTNREVFNASSSALCVKKCGTNQFHASNGSCALCTSSDEIITTPDAITACSVGVRCIDENTGISTLCNS